MKYQIGGTITLHVEFEIEAASEQEALRAAYNSAGSEYVSERPWVLKSPDNEEYWIEK